MTTCWIFLDIRGRLVVWGQGTGECDRTNSKHTDALTPARIP
ncbi:hypothetical protein [Scytonema sp. NUACC21]